MNARLSNPDLRHDLHDGRRHYRALTSEGVLAMTDTSDLVERLQDRINAMSGISPLLDEAATTLKAKDKEIEALRAELVVVDECTEDLAARAETAERRVAELEAHCVRLGQGGAERYWEDRWRDEAKENDQLRRERDEARAAIQAAEQMISEHIEEFHDFDYAPHDVPPELSQLRGLQHHLLGSLTDENGEPFRAARAVIKQGE